MEDFDSEDAISKSEFIREKHGTENQTTIRPKHDLTLNTAHQKTAKCRGKGQEQMEFARSLCFQVSDPERQRTKLEIEEAKKCGEKLRQRQRQLPTEEKERRSNEVIETPLGIPPAATLARYALVQLNEPTVRYENYSYVFTRKGHIRRGLS